MQHPTHEQFTRYQSAFVYFNESLFGGALPPAMLNFSRKAKSLGYFVPDAWGRAGGGDVVPEISLNPDYLEERGVKDTLSTPVHEMAHHWQQCFGEPGRRGYHNKEWAEKMKQLGLYPSSTGAPGGKETGQRMSHYIVDGGAFDDAYQRMPPDVALPWSTKCRLDAIGGPKKPLSKVPYVCPGCETKVWGKPGLGSLVCGDCGDSFEEQS